MNQAMRLLSVALLSATILAGASAPTFAASHAARMAPKAAKTARAIRKLRPVAIKTKAKDGLDKLKIARTHRIRKGSVAPKAGKRSDSPNFG